MLFLWKDRTHSIKMPPESSEQGETKNRQISNSSSSTPLREARQLSPVAQRPMHESIRKNSSENSTMKRSAEGITCLWCREVGAENEHSIKICTRF